MERLNAEQTVKLTTLRAEVKNLTDDLNTAITTHNSIVKQYYQPIVEKSALLQEKWEEMQGFAQEVADEAGTFYQQGSQEWANSENGALYMEWLERFQETQNSYGFESPFDDGDEPELETVDMSEEFSNIDNLTEAPSAPVDMVLHNKEEDDDEDDEDEDEDEDDEDEEDEEDDEEPEEEDEVDEVDLRKKAKALGYKLVRK